MNIFYKKMNNKIYKYYAGRGIARIDYDRFNNPVRIQFTNGSVTKYVYSAAGEKLGVEYRVAAPNVTVAFGSFRELAPSEIQSADSSDFINMIIT